MDQPNNPTPTTPTKDQSGLSAGQSPPTNITGAGSSPTVPPPSPVSPLSVPTPSVSSPGSSFPTTNISAENSIATPPNKSHKLLYIIALIVIILTIGALATVAVSFINKNKPKTEQNQITQDQTVTIPQPTISLTQPDADTLKLSIQGTSDEVTDIEKDLNSTNFTDLDKEVDQIGSVLSQP